MLNHPYVVAAFEGAGAVVGIALGTKHVVKELLLCALSGSSTKERRAAKESLRDTEWAYVNVEIVQMGAFSPSKGSIKAPTTPEPFTPRLPSSAPSDAVAVMSHPIVLTSSGPSSDSEDSED